MKIIIIAGGEGKRWNNYKGIRKHFAVINGERLIDRTIRLFKDVAEGEILFFTKRGSFVDGVTNAFNIRPLQQKYDDIEKIAITRPFWNENGKTLLLLGDVYFTDEGADVIKNHNAKDWFQYGRLGRSNIKWKHPSNENFALSFYPEHFDLILNSMDKSVELLKEGKIRHNKMAQLYRIMCGKEGIEADYRQLPQENLGHFVEINDATDDIDYPEDYEDFIKYFERNNK